MARTFVTASSEKIDLSLGAGASITGAVTLAAIIKLAATSANYTILDIGNVAATSRRLIAATSGGNAVVRLRSNNAVQQDSAGSIGTGWAFIAATKAAGTATPRAHIYVYSTDTWRHANMGGTLGDSTPSGASRLGDNGSGAANPFGGDLAIVGAYASDMTDQQIEAMAYDLMAWFQIQPNGLWLLDQSSTSMNVIDLTGNGANQSGITGTTVSTSSVPVFSYGAPIVIERVTTVATVTGTASGSATSSGSATGTVTVPGTSSGSGTSTGTATGTVTTPGAATTTAASGFFVGGGEKQRQPSHTHSRTRIRIRLTIRDSIHHHTRDRIRLPVRTVTGRSVSKCRDRIPVRIHDQSRTSATHAVRLGLATDCTQQSFSKSSGSVRLHPTDAHATKPADMLRAALDDQELIEILTRL